MTRKEAIATLRKSLMQLQDGPGRAASLDAFEGLVDDLEAAEAVLDVAYDDLVAVMPQLKPTVDRIVFSRRAAKK